MEEGILDAIVRMLSTQAHPKENALTLFEEIEITTTSCVFLKVTRCPKEFIKKASVLKARNYKDEMEKMSIVCTPIE